MTMEAHGVPVAGPDETPGLGPEQVARAVRQAQQVVGLYGDPDVTWGISFAATFDAHVDLAGAEERLEQLVREWPHLGAVPVVERVPDEEWQRRCEEVACADLLADGRLVRLLVDESATRVFVTVHHGVSDGLGMLSLVTAVTNRPIEYFARGIGDRQSQRNFLLSSVARLGEAIVRPPTRFSGTGDSPAGTPDMMPVRTTPTRQVRSVNAAHALARAHATWPRNRTSGGHRFLVIMGASRRELGGSVPDRQTAYFRIPLSTSWPAERVEAALRAAEPEPDFPESSAGGIGPMIIRALKNRLGCTVNMANLGVVSGPGLVSAAVYPALNGPMAVGVGFVTTAPDSSGVGGTTTISLRMRRSDFSEDEATRLLDLIDEYLPQPS